MNPATSSGYACRFGVGDLDVPEEEFDVWSLRGVQVCRTFQATEQTQLKSKDEPVIACACYLFELWDGLDFAGRILLFDFVHGQSQQLDLNPHQGVTENTKVMEV